MTNTRRPIWRALAVGIMLVLAVAAAAMAQQPGTNEFKPIDQLPPSEQLPGGAFVVVAYGFLWVATMVYLWSVWRDGKRIAMGGPVADADAAEREGRSWCRQNAGGEPDRVRRL